MRFSIQVGRAKKQNQLKDAEIEEYQNNFDKMIANQNLMRRTQLFNTVSNNLQMQVE